MERRAALAVETSLAADWKVVRNNRLRKPATDLNMFLQQEAWRRQTGVAVDLVDVSRPAWEWAA